ncbi:phosphotransferase enzyme family protein [Lysobacter korlensis]|uniref:Phosphotransferase enzyme family protein n=1 Tax=Lysobacter korlensis TaxID=553636 RepID=A0ABV6RV40_9GAMM
MTGDEDVLAEGGVTRVVRLGDTVRRPVRPFTATVHAFLRHLHESRVDFVPAPLGYDDEGREVLSFVPGDIPVEPLPAWATREAVLVGLARLIRRMHDAAEEWTAPPDAVWGRIPGAPVANVVPLFETPELVAHSDYCPGNVVFRDGVPAAFIDFDLARPTTRVADCVNALYWWAPLLHPADRAASLADADVAQRVRVFADAYGLDAAQRALVVRTAVQRSRNSLLTMRAAADADPLFERWWDEGVKDRLARAERWLAAEAPHIDATLRC